MALPSILSSINIAIVENITNAATMGKRRFQFTNFRYLNITIVAEVSDKRPERVTASPYEGIRKGSTVIMNMPNPKPIVLCTKLAPAARKMIYRMFSNMKFYIHKWSRRKLNFVFSYSIYYIVLLILNIVMDGSGSFAASSHRENHSGSASYGISTCVNTLLAC